MIRFIKEKIVLTLLSFCVFLFPPFVKLIIASEENQKIIISIKQYKLTVEVADTNIKRTLGLMYRKELAEDEGILFVFKKPANVSFWMKNTFIPLSIAFIDEKGVIVEITDLKPNDLTNKTSRKKVLFALEVNQGWFKKRGIKTGDKIMELKAIIN